MIFTFTKKRSDHPIEDNQTNTTVEFETIELSEIVANFEDFLRGCGFRFDGVLDFVEDEERVATNFWKGDPTCGGIAENYMSKKASEK